MRHEWLLVAALVAEAGFGAEWARFRGPNGSGVGEGAGLPVEFGAAKNVRWKTAAPFGRSSPIVAGGKVFLTAAEKGALLTLAYDLKTGKELWRRELRPGKFKEIYKANDPASPTPASDGKNVYVFFADFGLIAYSLDGKEQWRRPMGPFSNFYGLSSSPVVAGGLVMLLCDQGKGSFLVAVEAATGKEKWRAERPDAPEGWGVPVVFEDQVVAVGSLQVDGYHLATGERRWWMPLASNGSMGSPVIYGDTVLVTASGSEESWMPTFASVLAKVDKNGDGLASAEECKDEKDWVEHFGWVDGNGDGQLDAKEWETARRFGVGNYGAVAIPLRGKGRLEQTAVKWRVKRNLPYVPAPVLYGGVFYMVKSGGIITSMDPGSGEIFKQGRSPQALGEYFASPVAGDGKIYALSAEGKMTVLRAGREWEVMAVNDLGDEVFATPAIAGDLLVVRTRGMLYGFGGGKP